MLRLFNPNASPEKVRITGVDARRIRLDEEATVRGGFELMSGEIASFLLPS